MIPTWIFALFIGLFVGIVIWDYHIRKNLMEENQTIAHFLDMYIAKYGPFPGIIEVSEEDVNDSSKK